MCKLSVVIVFLVCNQIMAIGYLNLKISPLLIYSWVIKVLWLVMLIWTSVPLNLWPRKSAKVRPLHVQVRWYLAYRSCPSFLLCTFHEIRALQAKLCWLHIYIYISLFVCLFTYVIIYIYSMLKETQLIYSLCYSACLSTMCMPASYPSRVFPWDPPSTLGRHNYTTDKQSYWELRLCWNDGRTAHKGVVTQ